MEKPDWRKPEDYNYTKGLGPLEWAWEFLRRNEEYRCDYQGCIRKDNKNSKKCAEKWGLRRMYDPAICHQRVEFLVQDFPVVTEMPDDLRFCTEEDEYSGGEEFANRYAVVVYDLARDLPRQLKKTGAILKRRANMLKNSGLITRRNTRVPPELPATRHLRVLDALATGIKPKPADIARIINPGTKRAENESHAKLGAEHIKAAREMAAVGYKHYICRAFTDG